MSDVYKLSKELPIDERYGLTSQIRRCVISVPANIAEGAAKYSQRDFIRFLQISLGSLYELESHIILAEDMEFLKEKSATLIIKKVQTLQKRISALIHYNRSNL